MIQTPVFKGLRQQLVDLTGSTKNAVLSGLYYFPVTGEPARFGPAQGGGNLFARSSRAVISQVHREMIGG